MAHALCYVLLRGREAAHIVAAIALYPIAPATVLLPFPAVPCFSNPVQ